MGMQGKGGYGGISTMNQDQRQGYFAPHTVSKYMDHLSDTLHLKCVKCKASWQITGTQWQARDTGEMPLSCPPAERSEAVEVLGDES